MLSTFIGHTHYVWLVVASFFAGVMNAMAGGGSFVSFPAMLAMGVAPIQANATNTVALWPGQLTSVAALRDDLRKDLLPIVITASILGGVGGAIILLKTKQLTFLHMVPWLLLIASLLFGISGPVSRWLRKRALSKVKINTVGTSRDAKPSNLPLFLSFFPSVFISATLGPAPASSSCPRSLSSASRRCEP